MKSIAIASLLLLLPFTALGAFDFGVGRSVGGECSSVSRTMSRDWVTMKDFLAPGYEGRRPTSRDFQCIDPGYTRNHFEQGAAGGAQLRCFSNPETGGTGFCCNQSLDACAMFAPRR